ncbi:MAG: hypothetical protein NC302_05200 [Bacteroidales bacterium]|nr:hypothetical protein [Bacteroidales bacterium]MCM1415158.1 hypothetical protein [bacterium]MCM1423382.1 hypothetical protein [bacterium]
MAETILFAGILILCAGAVILLGIVQYRSKEPVAFWSGKKPPTREQITDVRAYNQKHGRMWILYGAGMIFCFVCGLPFEGSASAYLCLIEVIGGLLVMIAYHNRLNGMYYKKE